MKTKIEITNQDLYDKKIIDVDTSQLVCSDDKNFVASGNLEIETIKDGKIEIEGFFGSNDYEQEYGFILVPLHYIIIDSSQNTNKQYIAENDANCGDINSAKLFYSQKEAQEYINDNDWNSWAYVSQK